MEKQLTVTEDLSKINTKHGHLAEIIQKVKRGLKKVYQDNLVHVVLFGSQARGDARQDSDIDILVVLKNRYNQEENRQQMIILLSNLCLEYEVVVSCVYVSECQFKQEKSPLLLNIHQEGIFL